MFSNIFFFIYIFAGFAGGLAILMAVLLIKYWSSGNKELLAAIRNFMICTALIDALYFYFDYDMLINGEYGTNAFCRVIDICLFIGQVYFWGAYLRIKMEKSESLRIMQKGTRICSAVCIVLAVIGYGFLMTDYYHAEAGYERTSACIIEIILMTVLTFVNLWNMRSALCEILLQKRRRYIMWITALLVVNGLWNGFLVIVILNDDLNIMMEKTVDLTPVLLLATNIITILLILSEDFSAIFRHDAEVEAPADSLQRRLDYIAETHFLTEREREVMELAYEKLTNPEIADKLCISKYTVKNHMHNIFEKLDISTRTDLIMFIDKDE